MPNEPVSNEVLKRFNFGVTITKAWVQKNEETGKDHYYVKAIASDTGVDHHGERFTEKALDQMVYCISKSDPAPVILLPTHWDTFEIGKATGAAIIDSPTHEELKALEVTIELDMEYPQAKSLYKEVESGNAQKQLSVGGHLDMTVDDPYFWEEKEYEMEDGNIFYDWILVLNSLVLDHIAVTRKDQAANARTGFSEAIAKSLNLEDKPERKLKQKEVSGMSAEAEKRAKSLIDQVTKGITDFFKSTDADSVKEAEAKATLEKAKELLASMKSEDVSDPELKGLISTLTVKSEEQPEKEEEKPEEEATKTSTTTTPEATPVLDVEALKSNIVEEVTKSVGDSHQETFKELAKSLGEVISQTLKSQVDPLVDRLAELEKSATGSKSLQGQEGTTSTTTTKSVEDEDSEEGSGMWSGIIKSAIPAHVIADKKFNQE